MRFTHNDVNYDITYAGNQNCLKIYFMAILRGFDDNIQTDHSYHFLPPNPCRRLKLVNEKYLTISQFTRKLLIAKILENSHKMYATSAKSLCD